MPHAMNGEVAELPFQACNFEVPAFISFGEVGQTFFVLVGLIREYEMMTTKSRFFNPSQCHLF